MNTVIRFLYYHSRSEWILDDAAPKPAPSEYEVEPAYPSVRNRRGLHTLQHSSGFGAGILDSGSDKLSCTQSIRIRRRHVDRLTRLYSAGESLYRSVRRSFSVLRLRCSSLTSQSMSPAATSDSLSGISLSTAASAEYGRANLLVLEGRRAADGVWLLGNTALLVDVILSPTAQLSTRKTASP